MEKEHCGKYPEEVDFMDYVRVLVRSKLKILGVFSAVILLAVIYLAAAPKVFTVHSLLSTGEVRGNPVAPPRQVIDNINADKYNMVLGNMLGIPGKDFPEILAENPRDTTLIKLRARSADADMAGNVLEKLGTMIIEEHGILIDNHVKKLEKEIEVLESVLEHRGLAIRSLNRKIKIHKQARARLEDGIGHAELEAETLKKIINTIKLISETEDSSGNKLDLLTKLAVFEHEKQMLQKKELISSKYMQISSIDIEVEDLGISISLEEHRKAELLKDILGKQSEIEKIRPTELLVSNELLESEVFPDKKTAILFAGFLGIILGIGYALAENWWKVNRLSWR